MSKTNSGAGRGARVAATAAIPAAPNAAGPAGPIEGQYFTGTDVVVNYGTYEGGNHASTQFEAEAAMTSLFGRVLTDDELKAIVSAPDGSSLGVSASSSDRLTIKVFHPLYDTYIRQFYMHNGELEMHNDYFFLKSKYAGVDPVTGKHIWKTDAPKGFGATIFSRQVVAARRLGVKRITVYAFQNEATAFRAGANGYYTWPRFGYNASLPSFSALRLQSNASRRPPSSAEATYNQAKDFRTLMSTEAGRSFWMKHGDSAHLVFSPEQSSKNSSDLRKYLLEAGVTDPGV